MSILLISHWQKPTNWKYGVILSERTHNIENSTLPQNGKFAKKHHEIPINRTVLNRFMLKTSVSSVARETRLITDFRFFELCVFAQQTFQKTSCSYLHVQRIIWPRTRSKASFFTAIFRLFHEVYLAFFFWRIAQRKHQLCEGENTTGASPLPKTFFLRIFLARTIQM